MNEISNYLPWISLLTIFSGMGILQWRIIGALDKALERQQIGVDAVLGGSEPSSDPRPKPGPVSLPPTEAPPAQPAPVPVSPIVDEALVAFVKKEEGFSAKAYGDFKQYSIGYGTKASSPTEVINEAEADKRLRAELSIAAQEVEKFIPNAPKGVKQGMIDFTYNLGTAWQHEELGPLLVNQQYEEAKKHVVLYVHAGGKVLQNLVNRRTLECEMFDQPL